MVGHVGEGQVLDDGLLHLCLVVAGVTGQILLDGDLPDAVVGGLIESHIVDGVIAGLVDVGVPHFHVVQPRAGDIGQQSAEGDAHQQQRLELLADAQVQQYAGHGDHDQVFPAAVHEEPGKAGLVHQLGQGL